jgi:arylsulfatase A-like enzyme
MDAQVGRMLDSLDELGLSGNTAIVLWGDHGWKLNDYGAWCKHTNFEIDTHVPMILADPDHRATAGQGSAALSEFVDIYPTLAELCGLEIPAHCEGSSMVPLLEDPRREWKRAAFSQYPRQGNHMGYSMRTEQFRYTEWIHRETGEIAARELYDHSRGPIADRNLAADAGYSETMRELSAMLNRGAGWREVRRQI